METSKQKTIYWVAKGFISFFMLFSAYFSYSHPDDLRMLGFPDYFRIELVIAKVIGAILLLIPQVSLRIREWIYAGFMITMVSAMIAHICSHDPIGKVLFVAIDFILIVTCIQIVYKYEHRQVSKIL
ncbi:DoxX family protein [Ohtaekwangia koreensis]|uniref:DoxX-like family protein n=1 Tax=Ohtaekwangia koreensis TaxID=688867 RepID=A0A1T5LP28_9BACT|nr:DoxX family protein [Ohtaekwangia koreensis]SKC77710.1 DoxX-like family protein [Ohtaekwangia koreensis]